MSVRFRFFKQIITALSALNAVSEVLKSPELGSTSEVTFYIVFGPGTGAGAIQIESAHDPNYTGTWAAEGSPVAWVAASRVHKLSVTSANIAMRARISTGVTGGTVDVYVTANG